MTSDNCISQIDFLDLKIIKIKIQALLLLRFNLRFETLLFDSPPIYSYMHRALFNPQKRAIWRYVSPHFWFLERLKINVILENSQEVKRGAWRVKNIVFQFYYQKICWVITIEFYFRTLWLVICTVNYYVKKC